ncbi:Transcription factor bHLH30 [Acorus gramineus]|uniref:Transcription factor bHLH30 n=1 Tax=Acorus gramineus TaxID=55184 RepID=A0AAV9BTJ7_ACOGR|nr:Transcription factor bHLH30 [Acorus gramineus]
MASRYGLGVYDGGASSSSSRGFGLQPAAELMQKMTVQEIMDAKALAASKSHSEAERRRRERINTHLAKLRSLLPSTTKTDKASLLAEVIQHVKELRRQTSMIAEDGRVPTESDELTVDAAQEDDGRTVIKASLCCDDRADLLPELIRALKSLRLKALRAEITTLGGRVRNVLVVAGEEAESDVAPPGQSVTSVVQEALRGVMERAVAAGEEVGGGGGGSKRQRTITNVGLLQQRSM